MFWRAQKLSKSLSVYLFVCNTIERQWLVIRHSHFAHTYEQNKWASASARAHTHTMCAYRMKEKLSTVVNLLSWGVAEGFQHCCHRDPIPSQRRLTHQIRKHWKPFQIPQQTFAFSLVSVSSLSFSLKKKKAEKNKPRKNMLDTWACLEIFSTKAVWHKYVRNFTWHLTPSCKDKYANTKATNR